MKYSSLFTQPPQTPINRAFPRVKSWLNSSPLFTTLHLDILFIGLRWVNRAFLFHGLRTDFKRKIDLFGFWRKSHRFGFPFGRRFSIHRFSQIFRVKSGEEWRTTLHPCKFLSYRYLHPFGEGWRVFLKVACCSDGFAIRRIKRFDLSNLGICNPPLSETIYIFLFTRLRLTLFKYFLVCQEI